MDAVVTIIAMALDFQSHRRHPSSPTTNYSYYIPNWPTVNMYIILFKKFVNNNIKMCTSLYTIVNISYYFKIIVNNNKTMCIGYSGYTIKKCVQNRIKLKI